MAIPVSNLIKFCYNNGIFSGDDCGKGETLMNPVLYRSSELQEFI